MCATGCNGCDDCGGLECGVGPAGIDGLNAFTLTTADFTMPSVGANVTINVSTINQMSPLFGGVGQPIWIEGAGAFLVVSTTSATMTVTNSGGANNAAPAATISLGAKVSPSGLAGTSGGTGTNGQDGISVLDLDSTINNTTSSAYAVVKTTTVAADTLENVDDFLRLEIDVIGDSGASSIPYSVKVEIDSNTMLELPGFANASEKNAIKIYIDLIVTDADEITPYLDFEMKNGIRTAQSMLLGAGNVSYVNTGATSTVDLSVANDIKVSLKSNGTANLSMTYYKVLKYKKLV